MSAKIVVGLVLLAAGGFVLASSSRASARPPKPTPTPLPPDPPLPPPPLPKGDGGGTTGRCSPTKKTTPRICVMVDPEKDSMSGVARMITGDPSRFRELLEGNKTLPVPGCSPPYKGRFAYVYEMDNPLGGVIRQNFFAPLSDVEISAANARLVDVHFESGAAPGKILVPEAWWRYFYLESGAPQLEAPGGVGTGVTYPPCP